MPQLLSLCSRAHEPQLLSPCATTTEARAPIARALQQEKPPQQEACAPQQKSTPAAATRESLRAAMKTQRSQKYNAGNMGSIAVPGRSHMPWSN